MELTSRQRLLAFAVTVLALAGLGIFLFVSGTAKHPTSAPSHQPSAPASSPPATAPTVQPSASAAASSQVNIYQWLPFTEQQLASAANVVTEFSAYYGTYSYAESTSSYLSRLQNLATTQLTQVIGSGYAAPGVAKLRDQGKQVAAGSAQINSMRAFGDSSITFVVTVNQKISQNHSTSQQSNQYAVTVANSTGGWLVNDIEPASAGNQ
jgi:hypothetical protein